MNYQKTLQEAKGKLDFAFKLLQKVDAKLMEEVKKGDIVFPHRENPMVDEPKLKVGQWYKDPKEDDLFYIDNIDCGFFRAYGVVNKKWLEKDNGHKFNTYFFSNRLVPATDKEVEEALTQEAKRRFPIPCKIDYLDNARCKDLEGYALHFENNELSADWKNRQVLFKDGQWAEIIEQPEEEPKLKKGKWYKYANIVALFQGRNSQTFGQHKGVGFLVKATLDWNFPWKPATENEVIEALSEQAKILGFKQGDEIYDIDGYETNVSYYEARLLGANNNEFELGTAIVMRDGQWAEYRKVSDEVEKLELPLYDMSTEDLLDAQMAITRELLSRELK